MPQITTVVYYRQGKLVVVASVGLMSSGLPSSIIQQVREGVSLLKKGGIVAFPTDTVYGLGAAASSPQAVARVYEVKKRPRDIPLPLLLASIAQIEEVARPGTLARHLAERFLPGALTLVLAKSPLVPDIVTAGRETVAVRIPAHPVPVALVEGLGAPVLGTSANLSGRPSALTAGEVASQLGDRVDLVIDGGRCPGGRESTIVDVTGEVPVVLREGALSVGELTRAFPGVTFRRVPVTREHS
jgi:L-threonylcarbamoyladenylate synthase